MAQISQKIDKLTNSILNRLSGDSFDTDVIKLDKNELKNINKKWKFDWTKEFKDGDVYKLVIRSSPEVIQGLMSIAIDRGFIFVRLIESAPHNFGQNKVYQGVAGNLFAYACKVSFENGFDGYVCFDSKTSLIDHYKKLLHAKVIGKNRMYLDTHAANILITKYFNK